MEAYDRRMASLRAGEFVPPAEDSYNPEADLRAHSLRHKKAPTEHESYLSKEELMELRKVQSERVEVSSLRFGIFKITVIISSLGGEEEALGYGSETKHGSADGWDCV
jgi:hypothetical protein